MPGRPLTFPDKCWRCGMHLVNAQGGKAHERSCILNRYVGLASRSISTPAKLEAVCFSPAENLLRPLMATLGARHAQLEPFLILDVYSGVIINE